MLNKSVLWKAVSIAIVAALMLATLPTVTVFAENDVNKQVEKRWERAVDAFARQAIGHKTAHNLVENWLKTHKNAKASEVAAVQRHLDVCNSSLAMAQATVSKHAGFDANGNVIDRALAVESIKLLTKYVQQHAASVRNLKSHIK